MQALAFAEILLGGMFMVSAIENIPMSELVKHGLHGAKLTPSTSGASFASFTEGGGGSGGLTAPTGSAPAGASDTKATGSPEAQAGKEVFESQKHRLEGFLKRPLTEKEVKELHQVQKEGKL